MGTKAILPIPKVTPRPEFIPALPDDALSWLAGTHGPPERRAMREIVQRGDLDGYAVWRRILRAMEELHRAEPGSDVAVH